MQASFQGRLQDGPASPALLLRGGGQGQDEERVPADSRNTNRYISY